MRLWDWVILLAVIGAAWYFWPTAKNVMTGSAPLVYGQSRL